MRDRLDNIEERFEEINQLLMDQEVVTNIERLTELSKERSELEPVVLAL